MKENRAALKNQSMARIRDVRNRIIMVTAVFLLLSYLVSVLVYKLTGYSDYMSEYISMMQDTFESGNLENLHEIAYPRVEVAAIILASALFILNMVLDAGFEGYCLLMSRGSKGGIRNLFDGFTFFSRVFLISLLRGLLILLGLVFFIVPGIVASYAYSMAIFVMYDNPEMGAIECLRTSRRLAVGKKGELFVLDLSLLGWYFLDWLVSAFLLPVVQLFLQPYRRLIRAGYYNQFIGYVPPREVPGENEPHE